MVACVNIFSVYFCPDEGCGQRLFVLLQVHRQPGRAGGDAGIERSLGSMYAAEGPERVLEGRGMNAPPDVFELMQRARAALDPD